MLTWTLAIAMSEPLTFTTTRGEQFTLPDSKHRPFVVEMVRSLDW